MKRKHEASSQPTLGIFRNSEYRKIKHGKERNLLADESANLGQQGQILRNKAAGVPVPVVT
jgi:hypothetical protein